MDGNERWVARVRPAPSQTTESLLLMPLGLDVWERGDDGLVVAATEAQLSTLEERRLADVDRLYTVAEWQARWEADQERGSDEGGRRT